MMCNECVMCYAYCNGYCNAFAVVITFTLDCMFCVECECKIYCNDHIKITVAYDVWMLMRIKAVRR